jgi:hypothetical protein
VKRVRGTLNGMRGSANEVRFRTAGIKRVVSGLIIGIMSYAMGRFVKLGARVSAT